MIFDLWDLTIKTVDTDLIKTEKQLEDAKLVLAKFEFIFQPANKRVQVMRSYPKKDQKEIILAIRELLVDWISSIEEDKSSKSPPHTLKDMTTYD